ncbi:OmpA family protein [Vibrio nomapromontoriensis]|uniref:OmpA family protein n=1 Tax=Vibrio nomapromontoriensis TaxID=2910246 RepID=UPI003D0A3820
MRRAGEINSNNLMVTSQTLGLALLLIGFSAQLFAQRYIVPFDSVQWRDGQDVDRCVLQVSDPHTGFDVQFVVIAAQPLQIRVERQSGRALPASTSFNTTKPIWANATAYATTTIEDVEVKGSTLIASHGAAYMLEDMTRGAWFNINAMDFDVYFPTTNFKPALQAFNQCQRELPAVNFQHARRVELQFEEGAMTLTEQQKDVIDDISTLIKKDKAIVKVLIDGYTDNTGDSVSNLQVAKQNGSDVAQWFVENGVSKTMLEIRGHGDRYPKYDNATQEGREKNRRVEIRLVRK